MELTKEIAEALLERWPVARLATLAPDGRPHLVPVVFARHDGHLWSPVDAKPKGSRELARIRNVRARPQVSLLLDHYDAAWCHLWWLRVDGRAAVVEGLDPNADAELGPVAAALRVKYPQYAEVPPLPRYAARHARRGGAGAKLVCGARGPGGRLTVRGLPHVVRRGWTARPT